MIKCLLILLIISSVSLRKLTRDSPIHLSDSNFKKYFEEVEIQGDALYVRIIKNNEKQERSILEEVAASLSNLQTPVIYIGFALIEDGHRLLEELRGQITQEKEQELELRNESFIMYQEKYSVVELEEHTSQKIINYLLAVIRPTPVYVERFHTFQELAKGSLSNQSFLFGIFQDEDDPLLTELNVVHKERSNFHFFYTFDKQRALEAYNVKDEFNRSKVLLVRSPLIPVFHPQERFLFYNYYKYGSLYKFFIDEIIGRVDFLNERTHSLYMAMEKPLVILVCDLYYEKRGAEIQENIASFAKVASELKNSNLAFTIARSFEIPFSEKLPYTFLKDMVAIYERHKDEEEEVMLQTPHFYVLKHQSLIQRNKSRINQTALSQFIQNYVKGKLKPYYKSEPLGSYDRENSEDPDVQTIVGEQFEDVVKNEAQDVMIFIYAPWCTISKSVKKIWSQLAKESRTVKTLKFIKVNGQNNEFDQNYEVIGFPTILLAKRDEKKKPIRFSGVPNESNLRQFLFANLGIKPNSPLEVDL